LPIDNPKRQEVEPTLRLITEADRLRRFNKALGTHVTSLEAFPVDFVAAVVEWSVMLAEKGLL
jgi:hypothetical protein